ncbi:LysM peptidoglycan-binding domain-containing protein [Rhodobacter sp. NSM]|uniref:LysM peptidoglycan-binding domain-containing protein n=1 Tax=Rhodobacter sp. NSM TaxID=3457501 RepID=UPI003FCF39B8
MPRTIAAIGLAALVAAPAAAQDGCGAEEALRPDETLSEIATRCGVSEETLREANGLAPAEVPTPQALMEIPEAGIGSRFENARRALADTAREVEDAANAAGRSAADYLSDDPDLGRDLRGFAQRLGIVDSGPADLVVETTAAGQLRLLASGLPPEAPVNVGLRREGGLDVLDVATTDASGRLDKVMDWPQGAAASGPLTLVVETADERIRLSSEPVARP